MNNNGSLPGHALPGNPGIPQGPARIVGKLERIEQLEMENLSIKTQNIALQEQKLQQDLIQANGMRQELQKELHKMKAILETKYKVDILALTTRILPDGTILDSSPQAPQGPPPQVQRPPSMPPRSPRQHPNPALPAPPREIQPVAIDDAPVSPVARLGDEVTVCPPPEGPTEGIALQPPPEPIVASGGN
jgi:hypothetical protein